MTAPRPDTSSILKEEEKTKQSQQQEHCSKEQEHCSQTVEEKEKAKVKEEEGKREQVVAAFPRREAQLKVDAALAVAADASFAPIVVLLVSIVVLSFVGVGIACWKAPPCKREDVLVILWGQCGLLGIFFVYIFWPHCGSDEPTSASLSSSVAAPTRKQESATTTTTSPPPPPTTTTLGKKKEVQAAAPNLTDRRMEKELVEKPTIRFCLDPQ